MNFPLSLPSAFSLAWDACAPTIFQAKAGAKFRDKSGEIVGFGPIRWKDLAPERADPRGLACAPAPRELVQLTQGTRVATSFAVETWPRG